MNPGTFQGAGTGVTATSSTSSSGTLVGQFLPGPSSIWLANPTFGTAEFLRTGVVKSYSQTYSTLASVLPNATIQNAQSPITDANWATGTFVSNAGGPFVTKLEKGGTFYYSIAQNAFYSYYSGTGAPLWKGGSSLTSAPTHIAPAGYNGKGCSDSTTFGGYALASLNYFNTSATDLTYFSSGTSTAVADTGLRIFGTSPSLCVAIRSQESVDAQTTGYILTSTNGTTWTNRTASISSPAQSCGRLVWSTPANAFIYVYNTGNIYTSTDGYTLTQRTSPSGMPTFSTNTYYGSAYSATSPTVTLISMGGYTAAGGPYLLRTTNGTTFTLVNLATAAGGAFASNIVPLIVYDASTGRFVMTAQTTDGPYAYSSDGETWVLDSNKAYTTINASGNQGMSYIDSNLYLHLGQAYGSSPGAYGGIPYVWTGRIGAAPDLVGISSAIAFASGSGLTNYLRIA